MRKFLGLFIFIAFLFPCYSSDYPNSLSDNAKISIISVDYNDVSHYLFSKSCMRFYDKDNDFDEVFDFEVFDDFEDKFFGLKFFLNNKKAKINSKPFMEFYLYNSQQTNVSLIESVLDLSSEEVKYIYNFVMKIYKALPDYEYDFDLTENNSETHISQILHDCNRMLFNKKSNFFSFESVTKHNMNYKKVNESYVLLSNKEYIEISNKDFFTGTGFEKLYFVLSFSILAGLIFLLSLYQLITFFFPNYYIVSIYKMLQIFDFLILFSAGLCGSIIFIQDIFSEQAILRNNFQFLYLFPLHLIAAFFILGNLRYEKIMSVYWITSSLLYVLYISIVTIVNSELPLVSFLIGMLIFLRTMYYGLFNIFSILKKNGKLKIREVKK